MTSTHTPEVQTLIGEACRLESQRNVLAAALREVDALVRECLIGATKLVDDDVRLARVTAALEGLRAALKQAGVKP